MNPLRIDTILFASFTPTTKGGFSINHPCNNSLQFLDLMPELPIVECFRRLVERHCLNRRIVQVITREEGGGPLNGQFDSKVFELSSFETTTENNKNKQIDEQSFHNAMQNKTLKSVNRKGKYLWFDFKNSQPSVLFHFGMTGAFVIKDFPLIPHKSANILPDPWPPLHTKLRLVFENNRELVFIDQRRFGRIKLRDDPLNEPPISLLAIDAFADPLPSSEELVTMFSKYSTPIKTVLLDQNKVFCGIGNWVVDEVLFHSKIHPATITNTITITQAEALLHNLREIVTIAIENNMDFSKLPTTWLFHQRWKRNSSMSDGKKLILRFVIILLLCEIAVLKLLPYFCMLLRCNK